MALNRDFYADCFARSALGRFDGAAAPKAATPFAAAAKKEFDLTSFLKDLAAVRARDAMRCECGGTRGWWVECEARGGGGENVLSGFASGGRRAGGGERGRRRRSGRRGDGSR